MNNKHKSLVDDASLLLEQSNDGEFTLLKLQHAKKLLTECLQVIEGDSPNAVTQEAEIKIDKEKWKKFIDDEDQYSVSAGTVEHGVDVNDVGSCDRCTNPDCDCPPLPKEHGVDVDLVEQVADIMASEFGDGEPNETLAKELITLVTKHIEDKRVGLIENTLKILHSQSYFTFENESTPPTVQVVEWSNIVKLLEALRGDV